jgi:hypothetical protein
MRQLDLPTTLLTAAAAFAAGVPAVAQKHASEADYQHAFWLQSEPWQQFLAKQGGNWRVEWNAATSTPKAIWGSGIALQGWRENSLEEARRHANQMLLEHRDLLRLGASGFREIIGSRMGQTWTFTYQQTFLGLDVIGGRADVRVHMKGRVPMLGSMAFPIPADFDVTPTIDGELARALAWQALGALPTDVRQPAEQKAPRLVIWGDVQAADVAPCRLAYEVAVSNVDAAGQGPIGRYYIDARTGAVLHYSNDKHECGFDGCNLGKEPVAAAPAASALPPVATTVTVQGWTRIGVDALDPLVNVPLPGLVLNVPGIGSVTTDNNGQFTIDIAAATAITVGALDGRHHNPITGANAPSGSFTVNPGVPTTIQLLTSAATTNEAAHTTTSYWVDKTNEYCRSILGNTAQINTASGMAVTVNIASTCNAYYTGNTINFYQAGGGCSNTSFSTVVAHEWGHGLDDRYGGISQTNGLSEGWGDILGCYLLDTPNLGSGFQTAGVPLRSGNNTTQYPCSGCGVHTAGQSWMGFAWKLRNRLATTYGNRPQAITVTNDIVVSTIAANALNQADAVREVFVADDDDGNLSNGTPNYNDLVWACNQHSLPYPGQTSSVANDECATAIALQNGQNGPYSSVGAFTSSPAWACASGANDVWFTYAATGTGTLTVSLCNQAGWDTALQVFSGACTGLTSLGCNDDSCGTQSSLSVAVTAGQTYRIRVGGYAGATGSFNLSVTAPANAPAAPSNLAAVAAGTSQINLTWTDNATDEANYVVQRSTDGVTFANAVTLGANVVSWPDTGRAAGTQYWYRVQATNAGGGSAWSNVANATTTLPNPPAAPSALGATAISASQINLAWTDGSSDESNFVVQRSTDGVNFANAATLGANVVSWADTGRAAGTQYWYRVQATNAGGSSAWSNTASATTPAFAEFVATGQVTNHGTITGSFTLTHTADSVYQRLQERTASSRNSLQYDYTIANVPSTGTRTLRLKAYRTVSADNDTFIFQVRSGSSWINAITVSKTADDGIYQTYTLPSTVSGTVTVRVIDSNDVRNATGNDSVFVDHLCIRAQ